MLKKTHIHIYNLNTQPESDIHFDEVILIDVYPSMEFTNGAAEHRVALARSGELGLFWSNNIPEFRHDANRAEWSQPRVTSVL